ncbi:NADH dehydrogenase subunit L [Longilinea arvoryzae]|uniref:NADH dehydrogenase subunit L n=2 Tax=Longilinea arvoryzae TaxID=360412 RepID=A0A0S7BC32_9CHLR|nr:NADH dehydrogenase subunit L [Longilinea arvoryzae]
MLWLIPLPPLFAFALIVLGANRRNGLSTGLALGGAGLSWLASMVVFFRVIGIEGLSQNPIRLAVNWIPTGDTWLKIGVQVDPLAAVTLFFVAWTILMIFIYSVGYHNFGQPKGDRDVPGLPPHGATVTDAHGSHKVSSIEPMYARFFAMISLFAFGMYLLVVSDNLLTLFIGWEIMGLCSYLLIGFWYAKDSARRAAIKAFMTTRVGDMFMMLGLGALYSLTGTLSYQDIFGNAAVMHILTTTMSPVFGLSWAGFIGLLIFLGVVGKSAQFPLHVWLPDAMEGPTPVSAMIHAATMVSAGVYLAIRCFPLISAGWEPGGALTLPMLVLAAVGSFTALFAATIAMTQNDIKRVLAYSTISQLGYMIAALGVGAYAAATFHLVTHAFFKALLFLGSGSVIHGMEHGVFHTGEHIDPQNMFNMGGLRKRMPRTFWTFLIGGFALSGFPLMTAGFWSKDEILSGAFNGGHLLIFGVLALSALLTAFYTMRQISLTFLGKPRTAAAEHAQETALTMTGPLMVLAVFAVSAGWVGIPESFPGLGGVLPNWFEKFVGTMVNAGEAAPAGNSLVPLATSLVVALGGLLLGWLVYRNIERADAADPMAEPLGPAFVMCRNKYGIDEFYQAVLINPARWFAEIFVYKWVDKGLLDGILHAIARLGVILGGGLRRGFDLPVVNGGGDGIARGTRELGENLRPIQSGRIQQYMIVAISVLVLVGLVFFYLVFQA